MASTLGVALATLAPLAGCNSLREDLLKADDPDIIVPGAVKSAAGADAVRLGAISRLRDLGPGGGGSNGTVWTQGGLLVDEWKSANTFFQHNETDERKVQDNNSVVLAMIRDAYRVRTSAREAINLLNEFKPAPASNIGQMYFALAFAEMSLAENFCNGTPLGDASTGIPVYGPQLSNQAVYAIALAHADSGLALSTATDAASVQINYQLRVLKGRILINMGRFSDVNAVVSTVPTNFIFNATFALTSGDNAVWSINTSQKRFVVGDSVDPAGRIANAIPFASLKDPRVPNDGSSTGTSSLGRGFDNATNMIQQNLFARSAAMPYVTGVDARLQEAEVLLRADNYAGMMTILNALRASPQSLGAITSPAMAALPVPATKDAAIDLYFREKALWTYSRGQRLPDLRRLIRQYGRTAAQTFPTGIFFKTNTPYGNDVNFPVLREELANPAFTSCTDRNA
jgi:hypothetical protein